MNKCCGNCKYGDVDMDISCERQIGVWCKRFEEDDLVFFDDLCNQHEPKEANNETN